MGIWAYPALEDPDGPDAQRKVSRKRGPSKEHRKGPILQMGLLMDPNGIPMAFHTFSGNESEKTNMLPAIREVKKDFCLDRIIVVADRGLNTSDNTVLLSGVNASDEKNNDGYVTTMEKDKDGKGIPFKHKSRLYATSTKIYGK